MPWPPEVYPKTPDVPEPEDRRRQCSHCKRWYDENELRYPREGHWRVCRECREESAVEETPEYRAAEPDDDPFSDPPEESAESLAALREAVAGLKAAVAELERRLDDYAGLDAAPHPTHLPDIQADAFYSPRIDWARMRK